jgi:hypothetical protein
VFLALLMVSVASASDESLSRGISGSYVRALAMESTVIDLGHDGVYVITVYGCLGTQEKEGRGRWSIRDGILLLDRSGDRKEKRGSLSRFEIVVVGGDIALKPQDDVALVEDRDGSLLFRHQKQTANQSSEPTPTSVTTPAAQEIAPAAVVAHL